MTISLASLLGAWRGQHGLSDLPLPSLAQLFSSTATPLVHTQMTEKLLFGTKTSLLHFWLNELPKVFHFQAKPNLSNLPDRLPFTHHMALVSPQTFMLVVLKISLIYS